MKEQFKKLLAIIAAGALLAWPSINFVITHWTNIIAACDMVTGKTEQQVLYALKMEFEENELVGAANFEITAKDNGGLEQNNRKGALPRNQRWEPLMPLRSFSFSAWDRIRVDNSDILKNLKANGGILFNKYYDALRNVQDFIDERERARITNGRQDLDFKRLKLLNQNVIWAIEKHGKVIEEISEYFEKYYPAVDKQLSIADKAESVPLSTEGVMTGITGAVSRR